MRADSSGSNVVGIFPETCMQNVKIALQATFVLAWYLTTTFIRLSLTTFFMLLLEFYAKT